MGNQKFSKVIQLICLSLPLDHYVIFLLSVEFVIFVVRHFLEHKPVSWRKGDKTAIC